VHAPLDLRSTTRINLELCFPELDLAQRRALERESLVQTARTMLEFAGLWCWPAERALSLVREVRGAELLQTARAQGRGVVLLAPHFGAWEIVGLYLSSVGPFALIYKTPRIREMKDFYVASRKRLGATVLPTDKGGVLGLHRALKRGDIVGIMPDQEPGYGAGIFVPFFGVLANTSPMSLKLAQKNGSPILLIWAERLPAAAGFCIHISAPRDDAMRDPDLAAAASAMNLELETLIRAAPAQYLWSYKRFRYRPPGLVNPYRHGVNERTVGVRR
jgi:KDO2-lipid IV(A) lauroyltransferase